MQLTRRLEGALLGRLLLQAEAGGKMEACAFGLFALHIDLTAHQGHQLTADAETQPGAAIFAGGGGIGLTKGFENMRRLLLRHADAAVFQGKFQGDPPIIRLL